MNNQSSPVPILGSFELQAIIASIPQELRDNNSIERINPKIDSVALPQGNLLSNEHISQFLLQQFQNQAAASAAAAAAIASSMASTGIANTNGVITNPCTTAPTATLNTPAGTNALLLPNFNPFALSGMPFGLPSLPPHNSFGFFPPMNQFRSSVSALPSPVPNNNQIVPDIRPRAFSSAATLQNSKDSSTERRRKRSLRMDTPAKPIAIRPLKNSNSSVLRHLVETEEELSHITLPPMPTCQDELKLRMDMAKVLNNADQSIKKSPDQTTGIRRIIEDQDLPDSVGPDSPFRHHPKYQKRSRQGPDMADAIAAFCVVSGMWQSDSDGKELDKGSNDSGYTSADSPKQSFSDILENAIVRELKLEA